jgi:hypothetical protein
MAGRDPHGPPWPTVANDNHRSDAAAIEVALDQIAEAIGRFMVREHICARRAANDNKPEKMAPDGDQKVDPQP